MLNRVCLVGRLTRDPELRKTGSAMAVTTFTIAVDDPYARRNQQSQDGSSQDRNNDGTLFMSCTVFGNRAENVAKYTRKGSLVSVEGRLRQRKYTNKDGVQVTVVETVADGVEFLEPKSAQSGVEPSFNQTQPGSGYASQEEQGNKLETIDVVDEELPF